MDPDPLGFYFYPDLGEKTLHERERLIPLLGLARKHGFFSASSPTNDRSSHCPDLTNPWARIEILVDGGGRPVVAPLPGPAPQFDFLGHLEVQSTSFD